MKAIRFAAPIPDVSRDEGGRRRPGVATSDRTPARPFGDVAEPSLPNDRWVRIRTRLGGICGSDLNVITLKASPSTSPFSSFPFVLGHENVGDVVEVGSAVTPRDTLVIASSPIRCSPATPRGIEPPCRGVSRR